MYVLQPTATIYSTARQEQLKCSSLHKGTDAYEQSQFMLQLLIDGLS